MRVEPAHVVEGLPSGKHKAPVDVIEALDTQLFERVTGLTLEDVHQLSAVGVFAPDHMNEAIWQFRLFEHGSLDYLKVGHEDTGTVTVGLYDHNIDVPVETLETATDDAPGS